MNNKYTDIPSVIQVIGNVYQNPSLLDDDKYSFHEEDFTEDFHKILFGSIYNLYKMGAKEITVNTIEDYLSQRPKSLATYKANKGPEYLEKAKENSQMSTFNYYYQRMKKMTLLRMYDNAGMDLSWLYDVDNILDAKKKQAQEDWLDNTSLESIAETIDRKITEVKIKYAENTEDNFEQAGEGVLRLLDQLQKNPEIGYPLFGPFVNTVTRGARLKKFYLRSAATGVGKTRAMIADACYIGCAEMYDSNEQKWISTGDPANTLFVTTEQEIDEIQTMMLAFLSDVDEGHILYNNYLEGEYERIIYAAELLKKSLIHIKKLPDFSLQDVENVIRFACHEWDVQYVFFDYLHTSMKILGEVSSKTGVKGLREDNILFMMSIKLKDLCNQYAIFIMTATQLNADYVTAQQYDQNLLRGAKSIADKIDCGMIMLQTSQDDKDALRPLLNQKGLSEPGIKISIYKNRRGQYKDILLWCKANRATCRIEPMFATDYQYKIIEMPDIKPKVIKTELRASAF